LNIYIDEKNLEDFSNMIVSLPMFQDINNSDNLKKLITNVLKDLYIKIPEEIILFLNNKPSKKFLTLFFMQMGIDEYITNSIPDDFKTKLIYVLNQLFEVRGTPKVYKYFNDLMEEITGPINFYNVTVIESDEYLNDNLQRPIIKKLEYYDQERFKVDSITNVDIDGYYPIEDYYAKNYPVIKFIPSIFIDHNTLRKQYIVKCNVYPWERIKVTLNNSTDSDLQIVYIEPLNYSGITEIKLKIKEAMASGTKMFKYVLNPLLINNDKNIIEDLNDIGNDIISHKYFMKIEQFIMNSEYSLKNKKIKRNLFPIKTNVLIMQMTSNDDIFDTMKIYPDLVRMYGVTALQNETYYINIGNYSNRIPLPDYLDVLSYLKLQEIKYKNPNWDFNGVIKKFDYNTNSYQEVPVYFSYLMYPLSVLPEIESLMVAYNDIKIDTLSIYNLDENQNKILKRISPYEQYHTFKNKFQKLLSLQEIIRLDTIKTSNDFKYKLSGNKPETITELIKILTDNIKEKIENTIIQDQYIFNLNFIVKEWGLTDTEVDPFINLLINYDITNYDLYKNKIFVKYPRLIQEIDNLKTKADLGYINENSITDILSGSNQTGVIDKELGAKIYFETFVKLYKQIEPDILKQNDYIKYFFRDTFSRYILGKTFKENFFDPIVNLFNNYFFNIDQSYVNIDTQKSIIRDKMNFIPLDSRIKLEVNYRDFTRDLFILNNHKQTILSKIISKKINLLDNTNLSLTTKKEEKINRIDKSYKQIFTKFNDKLIDLNYNEIINFEIRTYPNYIKDDPSSLDLNNYTIKN
jgi:hypothetical protein